MATIQIAPENTPSIRAMVSDQLAETLIAKYHRLRDDKTGIIKFSMLFDNPDFPAGSVFTRMQVLDKLGRLDKDTLKTYLSGLDIQIDEASIIETAGEAVRSGFTGIRQAIKAVESIMFGTGLRDGFREPLTTSEAQAQLALLDKREKELQTKLLGISKEQTTAKTSIDSAKAKRASCGDAVEQLDKTISKIKKIIREEDAKYEACVSAVMDKYKGELASWTAQLQDASDRKAQWTTPDSAWMAEHLRHGRCKEQYGGEFAYTGGVRGVGGACWGGCQEFECARTPDVIEGARQSVQGRRPQQPDFTGICGAKRVINMPIQISCIECSQQLSVEGSNNILQNISMASECISNVVAQSITEIEAGKADLTKLEKASETAKKEMQELNAQRMELTKLKPTDTPVQRVSAISSSSGKDGQQTSSTTSTTSTTSTEQASQSIVILGLPPIVLIILIFIILAIIIGTIIAITRKSTPKSFIVI